MMATRYDYDNVEEFIKDRALGTHSALKSVAYNEVLFGQILRNVMKHAFECGVVYSGGQIKKGDYE